MQHFLKEILLANFDRRIALIKSLGKHTNILDDKRPVSPLIKKDGSGSYISQCAGERYDLNISNTNRMSIFYSQIT